MKNREERGLVLGEVEEHDTGATDLKGENVADPFGFGFSCVGRMGMLKGDNMRC